MLLQLSFPRPTKAMIMAVLAGTSLSCAVPVAAQDANVVPVELEIEDVGASARVDYSGRLRLFSQKIAADACYFASGLDPENAKALLIDAIAQYDRYIIGLRDGDDELGIFGPEKRTKTLKHIETLMALWAPFKAAGEALAAGENVEQNLAIIAGQNMALLDQAIILASEVNAEYANPAEMTAANAMVLDIAGRQRMLTQKISKEACGVKTADAAFGTLEDLKKTMHMFDASLTALRNGMPEAGIMTPPTPELVTSLEAAAASWAPINAGLLQLEASLADTPDEVSVDLFNRLEALREEMKLITIQYREFAILKI
jgi:hypothetical protein